MAVFIMITSHLFLLTLICVITSASVTGESGFLQLSGYLDEDMLSRHMHRLYEKYNRENRLKEGNTIRSFRAILDPADQRTIFRLNLTSLQESEAILSATFHFLLEKHSHAKPWICKRFRSLSCRFPSTNPSPSIMLLFRSFSSGSEVRRGPVESSLGNVTFHPHRRGVWQMKDVTQIIQAALDRGQFLVSVEVDFGLPQHKKQENILSAVSMPYLLLYANDIALAEPNSVASSLQRYDPISEGAELLHMSNSSPRLKGRLRREANLLPDLIQNNELPEVDYRPGGHRKDDLWELNWHLALKPKFKSEKKKKRSKGQERGREEQDKAKPPAIKEEERKAHQFQTNGSTNKTLKGGPMLSAADRQRSDRITGRKNGGKNRKNTQSSFLSFDEQTMRKARRRQWSHDRRCSRRNLRVDFADIGWSEWVIAPTSFDAYYCAGACGFPMPQVVKPSNHATIQSIVRAVGIIPGIPEPCCVPENMSPLAVLFQDDSRDLVLKVYPNMSVQSCSCR